MCLYDKLYKNTVFDQYPNITATLMYSEAI